jgi:hypothetical protein
VAGARYKVTRRCLERRYFLVPDAQRKELREFIGYVLGLCLEKYGMELYAACFLSNHHHTDLGDPQGNLPEFKAVFHGLLARGVNALRGRFDRFWSADAPCDTRRNSDDDSLGDLVYTLVNPTEAGLGRRGNRWEGFTTYGWKFGEVRRFRKPRWFFDDDGALPEVVDVKLSRPPILMELSDEQLYEKLMEKVRNAEEEKEREMRRENRRFKGESKVRKQHWNDSPASGERRFEVKPKVAASNKWLRLAVQQRNKEWELEYALARDEYRAGRDVVFPYGTWWMRRFVGAKVATAPP